MPDPLPCGHALIHMGPDGPDEVCTLPAGHDADDLSDHGDETTWPAATCETDLHEYLRPVLTLVYPGGVRLTWCALCAGRIMRKLSP